MPDAPTDGRDAWWALTAKALQDKLGSGDGGITPAEATARLARFGANVLVEKDDVTLAGLLWAQVKSPLVLILIFAATLSGVLGEWLDAGVVLFIVLCSALLGLYREWDANKAALKLRSQLVLRARVVRGGANADVAAETLVPGDVVLLQAGTLVPADGVLLEAVDLFVSQSGLTGESFPVQKDVGTCADDTPLPQRSNAVFQGTNVRSGEGRMLVTATGANTVFAQVAQSLSLRPPETEFERGLSRFGMMLTVAMLIMVLAVFAIHVFTHRPATDALLFAVALAVGLAPELLPAVLNFNLARASSLMAEKGVLVRRLEAIENLGSMDVLCSDKTGTLTAGVVNLEGALDAAGNPDPVTARLASLNAALQTGLHSPLDDAILAKVPDPSAGVRKVGEIPYDFVRKRLSVVVEDAGETTLVMKGALREVLSTCTKDMNGAALTAETLQAVQAQFERLSAQGCRVLGVARGRVAQGTAVTRELEKDLQFAGLLVFRDPPKEGAAQALAALQQSGVRLKMITGDNVLVATHVAQQVGMDTTRVLTGRDLLHMRDEALWHAVMDTHVFAEVDPNQKERIILALKKNNAVVGYLGDGINDAPALHAADVGISVMDAVDVAREAADFVLVRHGLDVLMDGVRSGRVTFANTLKYVLTTTSANLGNMISMAVASLWLPFLPLLASQVLLNNFLSDIPAMGVASDAVDEELVARPRRWDMGFIGRFMLEFGLLSSVFDLLTFALLLLVLKAGEAQFQTMWFMESLLTELAVALVVRTRRPAWKSTPGRLLWTSSLGVAVASMAIPFVPGAQLLGFVPLPAWWLGLMVLVVLVYVASAEALKAFFFRQAENA